MGLGLLNLIIRWDLVQEDKPDVQVESYVEKEKTTSVEQEIVLADDYPPESTLSFNDNETVEEGTESSAESPCFDEVDQSCWKKYALKGHIKYSGIKYNFI